MPAVSMKDCRVLTSVSRDLLASKMPSVFLHYDGVAALS